MICTPRKLNNQYFCVEHRLRELQISSLFNLICASHVVHCIISSFLELQRVSYFQVLHVGGQIDIVLCWSTDLASQESGKKGKSSVVRVGEIFEKHQRIINLSENIENLYTHITLLQFA